MQSCVPTGLPLFLAVFEGGRFARLFSLSQVIGKGEVIGDGMPRKFGKKTENCLLNGKKKVAPLPQNEYDEINFTPKRKGGQRAGLF